MFFGKKQAFVALSLSNIGSYKVFMKKTVLYIATKSCNVDKQNLSTVELRNSYTSINTTYCQPSNLIPHFWNYKIVDKEGSPDLPCIMILSEIFGWFRSLSESRTYSSTSRALPELVDGQLAISYDYLADKLNFQKERIRRKLVKLEDLGVLSRDIRNIALEDGSRINQLYLSIDQEFFKACFRHPELDIRVRSTELASSDSTAFEDTPPFGGEHIRNKNKIRSINLSNSFENNLESKNINAKSEHKHKEGSFENLKEQGRAEAEVTSTNNNMLQQSKQRQLEDFYPLSTEDCSSLQSTSGREFSLNAMNEILKSMSRRITNRFFYSKKGFLSYMSQVFRYEKRDAVKINNTDFRIRANLDSSEQKLQKQEKYLTELEYSLQVSPEWHLKKRLASVLERSKAYHFLTSYKSLNIKESRAIMQLNRFIELSEIDKDIILQQIQATHEKIDNNGDYQSVESLEIIMPNKSMLPPASTSTPLSSNITKAHQLERSFPKREGIWGKIRESFAKSFAAGGDDLDQAWLSKLDAKIDEDQKTIELKAPSNFIRDFIEDRFMSNLTKLVERSGFTLCGIK